MRIVFLLIELFDELVFGIQEAAWPLFRGELLLTYTQIGILVFVPNLASAIIEPVLGILGDIWKRRILIMGGGIFYAVALVLTALSHSFWPLLISFIVVFPASGAFVSLSQASLMDAATSRRSQNMARWTFAGSLGVVLGPIILSGALFTGLGWRALLLVLAVTAAGLVLAVWRNKGFFPAPQGKVARYSLTAAFRDAMQAALAALRSKRVIRWLVLLEFSDLMLDGLLGFLALYFTDVVGVTPIRAALAIVVWTGIGLLGDFLIIPLFERVSGLLYMRISVCLELALFLVFLLLPGFLPKIVVLALLGLFNSGWYAYLQGELYASLPGRSGTAMALGSLAGAAGKLLPLGVAVLADGFGLGAAIWLLLAGPIVLMVGLPRYRNA